ncbi:MAG: KTSC domain-containing protein [Nocardioides sp.]|nr:KTSC domain-containing protein [Nocardioides sp.]
MLREHGYHDAKDFEVQSSIHEYGHAYSGADNPTREEYQAFLQGARQQIMNDQSISEADKYRISNKQPGLITRLDQELTRVKTGQDENGRSLTSAQINQGKHFASMKRLGVLMQRQQAAKANFLEVYARTTGNSLAESKRRWDDLSSRSPEERKNTRISLTDDWQERLSVAGLTSQQQADMGQSNVARETMRLMESERQAKIRTLPSRPTVSNEDRQPFLKPNDPAVQVRCDGCGQFGHEQDACPNQAEVEAVQSATVSYEDAVETAIRHRNAAQAASDLSRLEKGEQVGVDLGDDTGLWVLDPRDPATVGSPEQGLHTNITAVPADDPRAADLLRDIAASGDPDKAHEAAMDAKEAGVSFEMAQDRLEEKRGPIPMVSSAVQDIGYNADAGVLEVTAHPYTRKRTGEVMPAKTYMYRMSPSEYGEMMASGSPGKYASQNFFGAGRNANYKFENAAEERESRTLRQCPSCGQFASMTSTHQCPIGGSMNSREEAAYRERLRIARDKANLSGLPASMADTTPRHRVEAISQSPLTDGGQMRFPERNQMLMQRDRGQVALGGFTAQYLGQRVTGRVYTWNEPSSGDALATSDTVSCTCGGPPCRHAEKAVDLMAVTYGAKTAQGITPGGRRFAPEPGTAQDAPTQLADRVPYGTIRDQRREAASTQKRVFAQYPGRRLYASLPIDAATGQPTQAPGTWGSGEGQVNLSEPDAVAARMRANLRETTGTDWQVRSSATGALRITASSKRTRGGKMSDFDQARLARALKLPVGRTGAKGVHVPAEPSWRSEFMDRSTGREPSVLGARFVVRSAGEAAGPQA